MAKQTQFPLFDNRGGGFHITAAVASYVLTIIHAKKAPFALLQSFFFKCERPSLSILQQLKIKHFYPLIRVKINTIKNSKKVENIPPLRVLLETVLRGSDTDLSSSGILRISPRSLSSRLGDTILSAFSKRSPVSFEYTSSTS